MTRTTSSPTEAEILQAAFSILGSRTSEKKAAAARANGRLGGRPHKRGKVSARTLARRRAAGNS